MTRLGVQIIGLHELDETLARMSGELSSSIMRSGLGAAATVFKKVIRANVNAVTIPYSTTDKKQQHPASIKRAARQSIGHSIKKDVRAGYELKVGFAVGAKGAKRNKRLSMGKTKGKGISRRNIHWWVLGTKTKNIGAVFAEVLRTSMLDAQDAALGRLRAKVWERIKIEATRPRTGRR